MNKPYKLLVCLIIGALFLLVQSNSYAQGVTTGTITGAVTDVDGNSLPSANVLAVHEPSGTQYGASTRLDGRFAIPGMRVG
ncbi:MAG TPA: carboxypeptidase-like regulatory domain-containing protein, partial [Ignavibacteriaceae bacterium]